MLHYCFMPLRHPPIRNSYKTPYLASVPPTAHPRTSPFSLVPFGFSPEDINHDLSLWSRSSTLSNPLSKFASLLPNIHESRPALQHPKGISHVILVCLAIRIHESLLTLALNFASPHAPVNWSQLRSSQHQPPAYYEGCNDGFDRDIYG